MQFLFLVAVAAFVFLLGTFDVSWNRIRDHPELWASDSQAAAFEAFSTAARIYVASTPAPASPTAYYWGTIKATAGMPSALSGMTFLSDWRVVRSSNNWAICATLDEPLVVKSDYVRISARFTGGWNHAYIGSSNTADESTIRSCVPSVKLQRGFVMIELVIGLIIMGLVLLSVFRWQSRNSTI